MLSVALVALGGGVALVSCLHQGTTSLALFASTADDEGPAEAAPCCADEGEPACCAAHHVAMVANHALHGPASCMTTQLVRLAPYDVAPSTACPQPAVVWAIAPFVLFLTLPLPLAAGSQRLASAAEARHGPPLRTRLTRLCVWRL